MTKDEHIRVYMTPETKQKIKEKSEQEGLDASVWMRLQAKKKLPQEATTA